MPVPKSDNIDQQTTLHRDDPQIQELRAEISQLMEVLSKIGHNCIQQQDHSPRGSTAETLRDLIDSTQDVLTSKEYNGPPGEVPTGQIIALKDRSPRGYYRQHTLFRFFDEVR